MAENIEISKSGYLNLINKVLENKNEERELALDRYRKADEQMETAEQFTLMGKNAVLFLSLAADSTNNLAALAKEIKSIVYKDEMGGDVNLSLSDSWKASIAERIEEVEKGRASKLLDDNEEVK